LQGFFYKVHNFKLVNYYILCYNKANCKTFCKIFGRNVGEVHSGRKGITPDETEGGKGMKMKRIITLFLALSMLVSLIACGNKAQTPQPQTAAPVEEVDPMALTATSLKVNNLNTPLGIDTTPVFCWTNRTRTVGRVQTAYQLIVASTPELAAAGTGDVWDTGKVTSDDNFDIPYGGAALTSFTDYYWAVRVWDETDTPGDWVTARFGTGVLNESEWTAKWIGGNKQPKGTDTAPAPMLRKGFSLSEDVKLAKIYICGLGLFELHVNGALATDAVLTPIDTQYEDTVSYCVYDVTKLLTKGQNAMAVELGNGFYNLTENISANFANGVWRDNPKLLLELHVEYTNGTKEVIVSDETWRCYDEGPLLVNNTYFGEQYDANREVEGWTKADFDDSSWSSVRMAEAPTGKLTFEKSEPMRRVKTLTPTIEKVDASTYRVYPGEFCTGWAKVTFRDAKKNSIIQIRYFQRESEIANGLHPSGSSSADLLKHLEMQVYTYLAKGVAGESYEPKFSYAGYEVIEISGYRGELKPEDIECYTVATDVEHIGSFESGNELVNQLHDMMVRTMICNMQGKPTDTPVFEKLGWTGDYNGAIKTFNYNLDTTNFIAHFTRNLRDTALETGQMNEYSPSGQIATWYDAPCWTQMYINSIYAAWHENGQLSLVREHYDYMCKQSDYWIEKINRGIPWIWDTEGINNRLGDWASPNGSISPPTAPPEGGYLYNTQAVYRTLTEMVEISTALGETENAARYQEAADNIYEAFNKEFYNPEKGIYETKQWNGSTTRTEYRQACNLAALYYGLCPEEYYDTVLENLLHDIKTKNYHADVGHIGAEIIMPLLSKEGYGDIALKILMQTDAPSWGYMAAQGSTTCWEGWSAGVRSKCHFFLGTYDEWFYQNLAGIQNPREGYKTVTIRPEVYKELGYVNASVDTVRGKLVSNWKVNSDGTVTMTVTVPVGTTADILLPIADSANVQLNGAALAVQTGIQEIGTQDGRVLVRAISGTYTFTLGTDAIVN